MKFSNLALLGAATLAVAQPQHAHNHAHKHKRGTVTTTAPGPIVTVYELNGLDVSWEDVEKGIADGKYILVGEEVASATTTSILSTSSVPSTSTAASTSVAPIVAIEKPVTTSSSSSSSSSSTSVKVTPTSSTTPVAVKTTSTSAAAAATTSASSGTSSGDTSSEFPSGTIKCSQFPSAYGPVAADWLGLGGWTGIQSTPDYSILDTAISYIETAISGSSCTTNSFCSYACPAGTQKSQWPSAQGSTGQSIGGLYCNSKGYLELSNTDEKSLCISGTGGVQVKSTLSQNALICRTDYPGTESETIALNVAPGATEPLTCPDASTYYQWEGSHTSAQYYINNQGLTEGQACIWGESGSDAGNWAPVNAGVGRGTDGITYISLFPNSPTNPDGVLNYSITITGASGECSYSGGKYYGTGGVESATGCTVSIPFILTCFS